MISSSTTRCWHNACTSVAASAKYRVRQSISKKPPRSTSGAASSMGLAYWRQLYASRWNARDSCTAPSSAMKARSSKAELMCITTAGSERRHRVGEGRADSSLSRQKTQHLAGKLVRESEASFRAGIEGDRFLVQPDHS